jgi:chlorobactene glucosyltransferase
VVPLWEVVLLLLLGFGVLLFHGVAVVLAYQMPPVEPDPPERPPSRTPTVSVIIAARNEEGDLGDCLDSLLRQDYPDLEIIVVDGNSTDRTVEVARARGPRVRVLSEPPLPAGWVGKCWACWTGAQAARGELLLFTDADVVHHPATVRTAVRYFEDERADVLTFTPLTETKSFLERVVVPFQMQMLLTYFRAPRTNRDGSSAAVITGQFWLTTRTAYDRVGGHAAVRGYVLEDVRMAQLYRAAGLRLRLAWVPELLLTRAYPSDRDLFEGLLKNIHGTEFRAAVQVGSIVGLVVFFWLPLALFPYAVWVGSLPLALMGALLWGALIAKHVGFARAGRVPGAYGLLFPLAAGYYMVLLGASIRHQGGRGAVTWKGRTYGTEVSPDGARPPGP